MAPERIGLYRLNAVLGSHLSHRVGVARRLRDVGTIVEWGGGFGSLMRLIVRIHGGEPTSVIFDIPIFSVLQWLYFSAVLGEEHIVLHGAGPVRPTSGRVNLVPVGLVGDTSVEPISSFSNWALNESMPGSAASRRCTTMVRRPLVVAGNAHRRPTHTSCSQRWGATGSSQCLHARTALAGGMSRLWPA